MKRLPLVVAGIIFSIVAIMHLIRIVYHWQILIAGYVIPVSVSVIALVVAIVLAIWMFTSAAKD